MAKIILASASPRRKDLLEKTGLKFTVDVSSVDEDLIKSKKQKPFELVECLSLEKAKNVAKKYKDAIIIAADSIVVFDNKIIGKPKDKKDAIRILKRLSGKKHLAITGFTIIDIQSGLIVTESVSTEVFFKNLSKEQIESYVKNKKPLDKAGAYAIQEVEKEFIEKIIGDYTNVVGLPVNLLLERLNKLC